MGPLAAKAIAIEAVTEPATDCGAQQPKAGPATSDPGINQLWLTRIVRPTPRCRGAPTMIRGTGNALAGPSVVAGRGCAQQPPDNPRDILATTSKKNGE